MENEVWKSIRGFEDSYMVSSMGRICSLDRIIEQKNRWGSKNKFRVKGRVLSPGNSRGYSYIKLGRKSKSKAVHRIVAETFIPNPLNLPEVNHKNCDKSDNRAENLEWCTRQHNLEHMRKNVEVNYHTKSVIGYKEDTVVSFSCISDADNFGFNRSAIQNVLAGLAKTHLGYEWAYS